MTNTDKDKKTELSNESLMSSGWYQIYGDSCSTFYRGEFCKVRHYRNGGWKFRCFDPDRKCSAWIWTLEDANDLWRILDGTENPGRKQ